MKQRKLRNGLTLFLFKDEQKHSVLIDFVTKIGGATSKYKVSNQVYTIPNGMAHLLEHLLIESSAYGNLMRVFGEMQMNTNGTTYTNRTEFYYNGVERTLEALPILLKAIDDASFDERAVEKVKGAIYEEIRRGDDSIGKSLFSLANACVFQKIPYRNGLGTIEDVQGLSFEEIKRCYESFYRLSNQYLVIAGAFDEEEVVALVEEICKELPKRDTEVELPYIKEPIQVKRKRGKVFLPTFLPIVEVCYKIDLSNYSAYERLELDFYMIYFYRMNFGAVSACSQSLQDEKIITGGISFDTFHLDDFMIMKVSASVNHRNAFVKRIQSVLENPVLDEDLFLLYQKESKINIALRQESIGDTVFPFLENYFTFSYPYPDTVEQIESYSFARFQEKVKSLSFTNYSVCCVEDPKE